MILNWNRLLAGMCTGIVVGAFIGKNVKKNIISSESALNLAKKAFKEDGPIDGSWIHMKPENIKKFNLPYKVYRGGITRTVADKTEQYEFLVDAATGTIIEVNPL